MKTYIVLFFLIFSSISAEEASFEKLSRQERVFYGADAAITSFPYFVSVEYKYDIHCGGGSIISHHFVLTAAHVFDLYMTWHSEDNFIEDYSEGDPIDESPGDSSTIAYSGDYPTELALNNFVDGPRLDEAFVLSPEPDSKNFVGESRLVRKSDSTIEPDSNNVIDGTISLKPYVPRENYQIRAGSDLRETGGSVHRIKIIIIHPDYVQNDGVDGTINDIALIRVVNPFVFDEFRQPIALRRTSIRNDTGVRVVVVGLGRTEHEWSPNHLKSGPLWISNRTKCEARFRNKQNIPVAKSAFCAGGGNGKRDTCNGDSGGPLVARDDGVVSLAGLTSFGKKICGQAGSPGVYTDVTLFRSWIETYVPLE